MSGTQILPSSEDALRAENRRLAQDLSDAESLIKTLLAERIEHVKFVKLATADMAYLLAQGATLPTARH